MKNQTICMLAFAAWMGIPVVEAESPPSVPSNFYGFQSEELFAERRSELLPVVSATKRGLYVETQNGAKRVSYQAKVGIRRKYFIAGNLIEITHQKPNFQFLGDGAYEQNAVSQMQGLDFSYDVQISELRQVSGSDYAQKIQELEAERSDYRDQTSESIEEGAPRMAGLHDTLNLELQLQAEHDVEDAFCILIISYTTDQSRGKTDKKVQTALRARYLGDIPGGAPHQATVQFELSAGEYEPADYRLLFYAGNGQPLPTNESNKLKKLTAEEVIDTMGR